jgi:hypothetical protein
MQKFKYLFYLLAAVLLTGCGQTVIETLHVPDPPDPSAKGAGSTILILPFADYSSAEVISGAFRRNLTVTEAMTDRLVSNGFGIAVQEDVFGYLVDEEIISIASYDGPSNTSLSSELNSIEWSNEMKSLLHGYLMEETIRTANISVESSPGTHALDQKAIAKLGRKFQADYVVRGRILEYKTRDEGSWAPWKKGIIPFVIGGTNRVFNGYASSEAYDQRNEAITGAILGGIIGYNNAGWPWADDKTILGMTDGSANALFWAGAGAGLGHVSHTSGKVDQAAVQLRVWVQEASTGNVIWTNRIRVLVSPETFFADKQYDTLFNAAIEKGVDTLIENFVTYAM